MPELIVFLRGRELLKAPVMQSEMTIGRDHGCDVHIDNPGVSRTHAVLTYDAGSFRIRDADSENGITLNGRPVKDSPIQFGDILGINKFKVHFSADGGVPLEMLEPPKRSVAGSANVVATMTVDADAAKAMQARYLAAKQQQAEAPSPANWPWFLAAGALLAGAAYLAYLML